MGRSDRRDQRVDVIAAEKTGQNRRLRLAVQDVLIDTGSLAHGGQFGDRRGSWPAPHPQDRARPPGACRRPTTGVRGETPERRFDGRAGCGRGPVPGWERALERRPRRGSFSPPLVRRNADCRGHLRTSTVTVFPQVRALIRRSATSASDRRPRCRSTGRTRTGAAAA